MHRHDFSSSFHRWRATALLTLEGKRRCETASKSASTTSRRHVGIPPGGGRACLSVRAPATTPSCYRASVSLYIFVVINQCPPSDRTAGVSIRCDLCNETRSMKDSTSGPVLKGVWWLALAPARLVICRVFSVRPPTCVRCRRPSRPLPPPQQGMTLSRASGNTRRLSFNS